MIINTDGNNKSLNIPNMVKRGFNQTPSDIKDKLIASQLAFKKQEQIAKNKANSLDAVTKVEALKKINKDL